MSNSASPSAHFDGRVGAGPKAMLHGVAWILASLATALAIYAIVCLVSAQNQREAGRIMIGAQKGTGYAGMVVRSLAAQNARPDRSY